MRYLSLFSGIEAASVAWHPLGWQPAAFAEVDPFACAVLRQRFPGVPNLGDVTKIDDDMIAALGPVDLVVGGSPCQDLSVAGKRAGLAGERSSLFHEQMRIFDAARSFCGARWLVWENVPGALSSNGGRDFAAVVGAMAGCRLDPPADGWGAEGVAVGDSGLVEWSVLDAQWFGVAQRRRRLFAVLDTGNWQDRPPVLLEPDSLRGDSPTRGEAREGVAADPRGCASGGGGPDVAPTLRAGKNSTGGDRPPGTDVDTCDSLIVQPFEVANPLTHRMGKGINTTVDEGQTPVLAHAFDARQSDVIQYGDKSGQLNTDGHWIGALAFDTAQVTSPANRSNPKPGDPCHTLCAAGDPPAVCVTGDRTHALTAEGFDASEDGTGRGTPMVAQQMSVRRLTPRECERLQGFPDDWTLIPYRGKQAADGPRYAALGNSMAVPVMRWIGEQLAMVSE